MTGLIVHPLRIRALDRMKVLRVPFMEQPKKEASIIDRELLDTKGIYQTWLRNPDGGLDEDFNAEYFKPPYAPGDYFVKETCYICRSADDGEALCDPPVVYAADGAKKNDEYPFVRTARVMPSWAARHYLTLGPPVPCRLGEVTEEMAIAEGTTYLKCNHSPGPYGCTDCMNTGYLEPPTLDLMLMWNQMYPKHTDPGTWTWGYPMTWRLK